MKNITVTLMALVLAAGAASCKEEISPEALAGCVSGDIRTFNPDQVELAIKALYRKHQRDEQAAGTEGNSDLAEPTPAPSAVPDPFALADTQELAKGLAFQAAVLEPEAFNDVLAHLIADYRKGPELRAAIENLVAVTRVAVGCQLREQHEEQPVITVIDDVLIVFSAVEGVGFAKGAWQSRGSGLKGIKRFRHITKTIFTALHLSGKTKLATLGIGTAAGLGHAILTHLQEKKLDPAAVLLAAQTTIVRDLGRKVAAYRDELRAVKTEKLSANGEKLRSRLNELDPELSKIQRELEHLFSVAQPARSDMQPVADDIRETKRLMARLTMQLDGRELSDALRDDTNVIP